MQQIYAIIGYPLGWVMYVLYHFVQNYGLALILFTLLTRALMIPLSIKQQKSSVKMALIRPEMEEIQKKYATNKEKQMEEMNKLYAREKFSPTSGCLPMLIQFPIMFGLIDVIYNPLKHILRIPAETITAMASVVEKLTGVALNYNTTQMEIIRLVRENPAAFANTGAEWIDKIVNLNLNFGPFDLTKTPTWHLDLLKDPVYMWLLLIPILSLVTSFLLSYTSMKNTAGTAPQMKGMNMSMMLMMPLFSAWFAFMVPAGVGFYWLISNVVYAIQNFILFKVYNPVEMAEKAKAEMEERKERERLERIEAKKKAKAGDAAAAEKALSQKELNRQKIAEARRRMAEKYGETYVEDENNQDI